MEEYRFTQLLIQSVEMASRHFQAYDCDIEVFGGQDGKLHYQKNVCMLGKSFVSLTVSHSGWGYQTNNEMDGFLITIPHLGEFTWKTCVGHHKARPGSVAIADVREVSVSAYASGINYASIYINHADLFKCLSGLLGAPPKTRVHFNRTIADAWGNRFITGLVNTIIDYAKSANSPVEKVANSLKETLIGFMLYNFDNNYSRILHDTHEVAIPTPHEIKLAAEYMASSTDPELTVGEVAMVAGVSVRSLQTGFKRYKNMRPIEFLRAERLQKSKMLLSTDGAVAGPQHAANQVGFLNYQVFCKYYIQAFGEHPNTTFQKAGRSNSKR
ncbi:helix-turn-helix transcriptional regulator [Pseudomonas syringae]|uniref:helix-turn-helix transcriptional regulator n=1 Tax=Pseudomonas syringae TaxID=317 RepID=UPI003F74CAFC